MPEGTKVERLYKHLLDKGFNKSSAARIAQSKTGLALATGKLPKHAANKYCADKNCMYCMVRHPIFKKYEFKESEHPRGQPENAGEFVEKEKQVEGTKNDERKNNWIKLGLSKQAIDELEFTQEYYGESKSVSRIKEEINHQRKRLREDKEQLAEYPQFYKKDILFREEKLKILEPLYKSLKEENASKENKLAEPTLQSLQDYSSEEKNKFKQSREWDDKRVLYDKQAAWWKTVQKEEISIEELYKIAKEVYSNEELYKKVKKKIADIIREHPEKAPKIRIKTEDLELWKKHIGSYKKYFPDPEFVEWIDKLEPTYFNSKGKRTSINLVLKDLVKNYIDNRSKNNNSIILRIDAEFNQKAKDLREKRGNASAREWLNKLIEQGEFNKQIDIAKKVFDKLSDKTAEDMARKFLGFTKARRKIDKFDAGGICYSGGKDEDGFGFSEIWLNGESYFFTIFSHELGHAIDATKQSEGKINKKVLLAPRKYSDNPEWLEIYNEEIKNNYAENKIPLTDYAGRGIPLEGFAELCMAVITGKCDGRKDDAPDFDPKKFPKAMKFLKDNDILKV